MRTGEQSGAACGGQAEVWVSVLVHASCMPVHFHLCIPTLVCICSCICMYYLCVLIVFMHVCLPQHRLCSFTNIQNGLLYGVLAGLGVPFYSQASHLYFQHPRSCCTHMTFGM